MQQLRPLIFIIVALAAAAYLGGIVWAGVASLASDTPPAIPEIVTYAITMLGGALATHFGAIFGIAQFTGGDPTRPIPSMLNINAWARTPLRSEEKPESMNWIQVGAAYVYVISLAGALIFWGLDGFSDQSAQVLSTMSFTFFGVLAGVITVVLNVKPRTE